MSTKGSGSLLAQAVKDLTVSWEQARSSWNDVKSAEFEEKFLAGLPTHATQAMAAIDELENLLDKIRRDCE